MKGNEYVVGDSRRRVLPHSQEVASQYHPALEEHVPAPGPGAMQAGKGQSRFFTARCLLAVRLKSELYTLSHFSVVGFAQESYTKCYDVLKFLEGQETYEE